MNGLAERDGLEAEECEDIATAVTPRDSPDVPLGVTRGLSNEHYHGDRSAVSSTQLKRILISPAHFLSALHDPEDSTEAALFGTVLHGRLLEPEMFDGRFYAMPKVNRAKKEGKRCMRVSSPRPGLVPPFRPRGQSPSSASWTTRWRIVERGRSSPTARPRWRWCGSMPRPASSAWSNWTGGTMRGSWPT